MADEPFVLHVNGKEYPIEADDLEVWEVEFLEEYCNASLGEIDFSRMRTIRALTWLVLHRTDEKITIDEVGKLKLSAFDEPDPTPAPKPGPKRSTARK